MKANEALLMVQIVKVTQQDYDTVQKLLTIARLAKKHTRLAEMQCNGEGYLKGTWYRLDGSTPAAYLADDTTVFDQESDKVEAKMRALVTQLGTGWAVEFQGDPRGNTVKVMHDGRFIELD